MDIQTIEEAIQELEQSPTSVENVKNLASLYICRQNIKPRLKSSNNTFKQDINEVFPAYNTYCNAKKAFQTGNGTEEAVLNALSLLCSEIKDLYISLNSSSSSRKERRILKESVESVICAYNK